MTKWLHRPCATCPFRLDQDYRLGRERAEGIARALRGDGAFHCHETVDYGEEGEGTVTLDSRFCGGALVVMAKEGILFSNLIPRLLAILKLLDPAKLDLNAPTDPTLEDWVGRQARHTI